MMTELFDAVASWQSLVLVVAIFGVAPGLCLRLIVKLYPRDDPRRKELVAELYVIRRIERPLFVAEQLETVLSEGAGNRIRRWRESRHIKRRATALWELSAPTAAWFDELVNGYQVMMNLGGVWRSEPLATIDAAATVFRRRAVSSRLRAPRVLASKVAVPTISHGRHALVFLPNRLLVRSGTGWEEVAYRDLRVTYARTEAIEYRRPPHDAPQTDAIWRYTDAQGRPDPRYQRNRLLPVVTYGQVTLTAANGVNWAIDCSRPNVAEWFATALSDHLE